MISFWRIFWLEWQSLVRSKTLALLLVAAVAWMFAAPHVFSGDGTAEGARALALHYSLGGVAALLAVALLASAAGSLSADRASKRLALTVVRPVRLAVIALGRIAALVACAAVVLMVAALVEWVRQDAPRDCRHVLRPVLPSPRVEAEQMYEQLMRDENAPEYLRKAKKGVLLRILTQRAMDHYVSAPTNRAIRFSFARPADKVSALAVRLRLSNAYDMRDDVCGRLCFGDWTGIVSNITQAVLTVPLSKDVGAVAPETDGGTVELEFFNGGAKSVMLRPRRDLEVLVPADGFGWNLCRATVELLAMVAMLVSFGVFLGAGLARPAALFTAIAVLTLSELSPSVVEQYPDELETDRVDSFGLVLTRLSAAATHPVSSLAPAAALSDDICIEWGELARASALGFVVFPLVCSLMAGLVMPRKQEGYC